MKMKLKTITLIGAIVPWAIIAKPLGVPESLCLALLAMQMICLGILGTIFVKEMRESTHKHNAVMKQLEEDWERKE